MNPEEENQVVDTMFWDVKGKKFLNARVPLKVLQEMNNQAQQNLAEGKGSEYTVKTNDGQEFHADEVLVDHVIDPDNSPYCRN